MVCPIFFRKTNNFKVRPKACTCLGQPPLEQPIPIIWEFYVQPPAVQRVYPRCGNRVLFSPLTVLRPANQPLSQRRRFCLHRPRHFGPQHVRLLRQQSVNRSDPSGQGWLFNTFKSYACGALRLYSSRRGAN